MDTLSKRLASLSSRLPPSIRLNDPLTVEEVQRFEDKYDLSLPADYKQFIICIGNGGDGPPPNGLLALGQLPPEWDIPQHVCLSRVQQPFPLEGRLVWGTSPFTGRSIPLPAREIIEKLDYGWLPLGADDDGSQWLLIVTGSQRGQVWQRFDQGIQPCCPGLTFLDWYEHWVDGDDDWWKDYDYEADRGLWDEE